MASFLNLQNVPRGTIRKSRRMGTHGDFAKIKNFRIFGVATWDDIDPVATLSYFAFDPCEARQECRKYRSHGSYAQVFVFEIPRHCFQ